MLLPCHPLILRKATDDFKYFIREFLSVYTQQGNGPAKKLPCPGFFSQWHLMWHIGKDDRRHSVSEFLGGMQFKGPNFFCMYICCYSYLCQRKQTPEQILCGECLKKASRPLALILPGSEPEFLQKGEIHNLNKLRGRSPLEINPKASWRHHESRNPWYLFTNANFKQFDLWIHLQVKCKNEIKHLKYSI